MTTINDPLTLPCGVTLPNRIVKAAMTEGVADKFNNPTDEHITLYQRWAQGGAGVSITGNVMVDRLHLERPGNIVIDQPHCHPKLVEMARAGKCSGGHIWMQIGHAGRQTPKYVNASPKGPSASSLKLANQFADCVALTHAEILDVIARFANAAAVAKEAGFTGVQIHAAHGFLISQFLSPLLNHRNDTWGGALINRARLLLDVVSAVRAAVGSDFPVAVKLNSEDFQKGGFSLNECLKVIKWLNKKKIDLLEVTGGSYETPKMVGFERSSGKHAQSISSTERREAYFLEYATIIRRVAKMPIMLTGGFRSKVVMNDALTKGDVDLIGLARPTIINPSIANALLSNSCEHADALDGELTWRPALFGPKSPFFIFRMINIQGQQAWFYEQIKRLSEGNSLDIRLGLSTALFRYFKYEKAKAAALRNDDSTHSRAVPIQQEEIS